MNKLDKLHVAMEKPTDKNQKYPIFVSFESLQDMKKYLPQKLYDDLELRMELGFMHGILGHERYKEEVETIIRAKRGLNTIPQIEYKIKHR